jgi:hypothetical protein
MTPRPVRIAVLAVLAAVAIPTKAFACWSLCVQTYGYYTQINGSTHYLDHCVQSWPDGANAPITTCYYAPYNSEDHEYY